MVTSAQSDEPGRANPPGRDVSFVYLVGRVNHGLRGEMRARLGRWQLSVPEFTAMSILERRPDLSNAQLARRSLVTPQAMIEILGGLERRGLVEREVDPAHSRILRARLTAAGHELLAAVEPAIDAIEDELMTDIGPDQRQIAYDVLFEAMRRLRLGLDDPAE